MIRRTRTGLLAVAAGALACSSLAFAHARLLSADPTPNATVGAAQAIHLQFSEAIVARFSSFRLTDTDGNPVALMSLKPRDASSLDAMPAARLAPGVYTVSWTAVSTDDGHRTTGSYSFTVQ
jgi:copper resistance protein C